MQRFQCQSLPQVDTPEVKTTSGFAQSAHECECAESTPPAPLQGLQMSFCVPCHALGHPHRTIPKVTSVTYSCLHRIVRGEVTQSGPSGPALLLSVSLCHLLWLMADAMAGLALE